MERKQNGFDLVGGIEAVLEARGIQYIKVEKTDRGISIYHKNPEILLAQEAVDALLRLGAKAAQGFECQNYIARNPQIGVLLPEGRVSIKSKIIEPPKERGLYEAINTELQKKYPRTDIPIRRGTGKYSK